MQNQAGINNGNNKAVRSFGLCYKIYTFIVYNVIGRGLKRLTSGVSSTDIPIKLPDEEEHLMQKPGCAATSNEIVVEFKQNSELEYWNRQWQRNDDDHKRKRQIDEKHTLSRRVDQDQELVFAASNGGRKRSAEKNVTASSESALLGVADSGKVMNGKKDKNVAATERLVTWGAEQKAEPRHHELQSGGHRPILSVLANINEKSDEFIRKKKEAIRKLYSSTSDHKHS